MLARLLPELTQEEMLLKKLENRNSIFLFGGVVTHQEVLLRSRNKSLVLLEVQRGPVE